MSNPNSKTVKVLSILTLVIVFYPFVTFADVFNLDLHYGVTHSEVRTLQQFLNLDVRTKLADEGTGSPGQETAYFGAKTDSAVRRFQELYKDQILTPFGLDQTTGYFGYATRQMANSVSSVIGFSPVVGSSVSGQDNTSAYKYSYDTQYQSGYQSDYQYQTQGSVATNPTDPKVIYVTNYVTNDYRTASTSRSNTDGGQPIQYTNPYVTPYVDPYANTNTNPQTPGNQNEDQNKKTTPSAPSPTGSVSGGGGSGGGATPSSKPDSSQDDKKEGNSTNNLIKSLLTQLICGVLMPGQTFPTVGGYGTPNSSWNSSLQLDGNSGTFNNLNPNNMCGGNRFNANYDPLNSNGQYVGQSNNYDNLVSPKNQLFTRYLCDKSAINPQAIQAAEQSFQQHSNDPKIQNKRYIGVMDYSRRSSDRRFYIVDREMHAVSCIVAAHGVNSDKDNDGFATEFSNTPNSEQSSLGAFAAKYYDSQNLRTKVLLLHGLDAENSNAASRYLEIHPSEYVHDNGQVGRSNGCIAYSADSGLHDEINLTLANAFVYGYFNH